MTEAEPRSLILVLWRSLSALAEATICMHLEGAATTSLRNHRLRKFVQLGIGGVTKSLVRDLWVGH